MQQRDGISDSFPVGVKRRWEFRESRIRLAQDDTGINGELLEAVKQILYREVDIAQDRPQKTWTKDFACMHRTVVVRPSG